MSDERFRLQYPSLWSDPMIQELMKNKKHLHVIFFSYALTGAQAGVNGSLAGIYEIHRGGFDMMLHLSGEEMDNIIQTFNEKYSAALEYDVANHMMFVKNFFKYNKKFKTPENVARWLLEGFQKTIMKAPNFWVEFVDRYREDLGEIYLKLEYKKENKKYIEFFDRLFELKNEVNLISFKTKPNIILQPESAKKLSEKTTLAYEI